MLLSGINFVILYYVFTHIFDNSRLFSERIRHTFNLLKTNQNPLKGVPAAVRDVLEMFLGVLGPGQGPCVSLGFSCLRWISESGVLLTVSLDSTT